MWHGGPSLSRGQVGGPAAGGRDVLVSAPLWESLARPTPAVLGPEGWRDGVGPAALWDSMALAAVQSLAAACGHRAVSPG